MSAIDTNMTVANLVATYPQTAKVFHKYRIDFCCGGHQPIAEACSTKGVEAETLYRELEAAAADRSAGRRGANELTTPTLIGWIIDHHHAYLRETLPITSQMMAKVARVHGENNPKLLALKAAYDELAAALPPHLDTEEQVLFPALEANTAGSEAIIRRELDSMYSDHLEVRDLLVRIREAADDFTVPEWGCNTYRALFAELSALEADLHEHIHLENHVLMPRFVPTA
jgi:regulator of cell morphogenesis and NO signaling